MACLCLVYLLISSLFACSRPGSGVSHVSLFWHSDEIKSDFLSLFSLFFSLFFLSLFSPGPGGGGHNVSVCLRVESFFFFFLIYGFSQSCHAAEFKRFDRIQFCAGHCSPTRPGRLRGYYITPRISNPPEPAAVALNSHWVN